MIAFDSTPVVAQMVVQDNAALATSLLALNAPLSLVRYIQQLARDGLSLRRVPVGLLPAAQFAYAHRVLAACATLTVYRQQFTVAAADCDKPEQCAQFAREQARRTLTIPVMQTWLASLDSGTVVGQREDWPCQSPCTGVLQLFTGWRWHISATNAALVDDPTLVIMLPLWARVFLIDLNRWCRQRRAVAIAAGDALTVLARSSQIQMATSAFHEIITPVALRN